MRVSARSESDRTAHSRRKPEWDEAAFLRPSWCGAQVQRSAAWCYALIAAGRLRAVRLNGSLRVPREAWESWLRENVEPAAPPPREPAA